VKKNALARSTSTIYVFKYFIAYLKSTYFFLPVNIRAKQPVIGNPAISFMPEQIPPDTAGQARRDFILMGM